MSTCPSCGKEHAGRGFFCAACNNPGKVPVRQVHRSNDRDRTAHMSYTEGMEKSEDGGWFYGDDDS